MLNKVLGTGSYTTERPREIPETRLLGGPSAPTAKGLHAAWGASSPTTCPHTEQRNSSPTSPTGRPLLKGDISPQWRLLLYPSSFSKKTTHTTLPSPPTRPPSSRPVSKPAGSVLENIPPAWRRVIAPLPLSQCRRLFPSPLFRLRPPPPDLELATPSTPPPGTAEMGAFLAQPETNSSRNGELAIPRKGVRSDAGRLRPSGSAKTSAPLATKGAELVQQLRRCFPDSPGEEMGAQSDQPPLGDLPARLPSPEAGGAEGELHALHANRASAPILTPKGKGRRRAAEGAAPMPEGTTQPGWKGAVFQGA